MTREGSLAVNFPKGGIIMERVYDKCCGIDVHKKLLVACFRNGNKQDVREFGATTREIFRLTDWLSQGGCQMVAMESTASYWKPLYNILESIDMPAMVVNAKHMKAVPWPQDRHQGRGMDSRPAAAWPPAGKLHPRQGPA